MWDLIKYWGLRVMGGLLLLIVVVSAFKSYAIVPVGHKGVVLNFGAAQPGGLQPGLHFITPYRTTVYNYNTQIQKTTFDVAGASIDSQDINAKVTLNWIPDPNKVGELLDSTGDNAAIVHKILNPATQGSFKAATAKFKANEILPKRPELKEIVVADLKERIEATNNVILQSVSVENLSFSKKYSEAIEAKAEAEQLALKAGYQKQEKEAIAQGVVAEAEGLAKAQRLQSLTISEKFLKLRQIEAQEKAIAKWDGALPKFTSGGNSMIMDVKSVLDGK